MTAPRNDLVAVERDDFPLRPVLRARVLETVRRSPLPLLPATGVAA